MGLSVINWGGVVNPNLSETSKYPLQTDVATKEFHRIESLRASTSQYGMTRLSTATDVTDINAYALSATENNPNIPNSLRYQYNQVSNKLNTLYNIKKAINVGSSCWVRLLSYSGTNAWYGGSSIIDVYIIRTWNHCSPDVHMFTIMHVTKTITLSNTYNTKNALVDKLRVMYNGDDFVAFDIHYNYSQYNDIFAELIPRTAISITGMVNEPMKIIADSPSGESLYKEFDLAN